MLKNFQRKLAAVLTGVVAGAMLSVAPVQAQEGKPIKMGWTAWSDAEVVTRLAVRVLEDRLGYKVDLTLADIGLVFQGIAKGDLDVMLLAWLPTTHKPYWDRFKNDVVDLGIIYGGARNGWVVPDYVPKSELDSIADLNKPEVEKKLGGKIQGIDPGAGLMQASEKAMKEYKLKGYKLVSASDAAMTAALARAEQRKDWIVVTGWSPHAMFAKWKLRYLEDPKKTLGGEEKVHALARKGFKEAFPRAAAFLENYQLDLADLQAVMFEATQSSYEEAVDKYLKAHPELVEEWVKTAMDKPQYGS